MNSIFLTSEARVLLAFSLAALCTLVVGFHLGAPVDPRLAEDRIRAFYDASYKEGALVSAEERDRTLADRGHEFTAPTRMPSAFSRMVSLLNWYPWAFGTSLAACLFLFRPRLRGAMAGVAAVALVALFGGPSAGIASGAALGAYLVMEAVFSRRSPAAGSGSPDS